MSSNELRQKFLDFFKARGHTIVPSSSLIPDDPSVLLTTAGMQQFKPYFLGEADPERDFGSKNTTSIQKSFRTSDIDSVGDESHLTFFEMLGNFSFGGYGKVEAIKYAHEFITGELDLEIDYVSVFGGEGDIPADQESKEIWGEVDENILVKEAGREDNFWGPTGTEGPCGPTTEIYVNGVEVWNIVFNEYYCHKNKSLTPLEFLGVDTGMGLERLAMVAQGKKNIFETDLFDFLRHSSVPSDISETAKRIIGDHARAIIFLVSDGVELSNKGAGYILRRLMRRLMVHSDFPGLGSVKGFGDRYGLGMSDAGNLFREIFSMYGHFYPELKPQKALEHYENEYKKFSDSLRAGLRELKKAEKIDAHFVFKLYESYGIPFEIIQDFLGEKSANVSREDFEAEFKKHQEVSRAGVEKKFGGHGLILDTGELKAGSEEEIKKVTRLHTATHLLNQALHDVLGDEVEQRGSDINIERTRFDFKFHRKVTAEEIAKIEAVVNEKIKADLPVTKKQMPLAEALEMGARAFFRQKYPEIVNVYSIGDPSTGSGQAYSKELCGGPHVASTNEIGRFKIIKEESSSGGVRRIRAIVE